MAAMGIKPKVKPLPDAPPFPFLIGHIWNWFNELAQGRSVTDFGLGSISWLDIKSWSEMTMTVLEPWEVRALMRLDVVFLIAQKPKKKAGDD